MARASAIGLEELEELEPLERLENPDAQTALKKRHVVLLKTTRRFFRKMHSFFHERVHLFFAPTKWGHT